MTAEKSGQTAQDSAVQNKMELNTARMAILEESGLGKVGADDASGIMDAIARRIEMMREASEETKAEQEALDKIKGRREGLQADASGENEALTESETETEGTGAKMPTGYTRTGTASSSSFTPKTGKFSRNL